MSLLRKALESPELLTDEQAKAVLEAVNSCFEPHTAGSEWQQLASRIPNARRHLESLKDEERARRQELEDIELGRSRFEPDDEEDSYYDLEEEEVNDEPTGFVDSSGYEDYGWCYKHSTISDLCRNEGKTDCVYALGPPVSIAELRSQAVR